MQFVYPSFLWALLALSIPIIIHLFYFRRFKTVYFTNVKFLKELKEESSSRNKLRNLLVLLMRCLAVAALVFAFAQPFIPNKNTLENGVKDVSIYIDNSFSMGASDAEAPLLEKAKQHAREIIAAYAPDDNFQILTSDFEGRHQRLVSQADALTLVDEVQVSPASQELSRVASRQRQALTNGVAPHKTAYIISDFQRSTAAMKPITDSVVSWTLVPLAAVQKKNISIDSCWFESPVPMLNQTNRLLVKINNRSEVAAENVRLTLTHNGQVKPVGNINLEAGKTKVDTIPITVMKTGWHKAEIALTDNPITFDDKYFFTFNVLPTIRILAIEETGGQNPYLTAIFRGTPYFQVTTSSVGSLDYSKLKDYNLVISNGLRTISSGLSSELSQYAKGGGNILVFPSPTVDVNTYNAFLRSLGGSGLGAWTGSKRGVSFINTNDFIFEDVYENTKAQNLTLPETQGNYSIGASPSNELLRYRDGSTFVSKNPVENGNLFLCAAPLDIQFNNLVKSAEVFVPMVYKMALSSGNNNRLAYFIGKDNTIETEQRATNAKAVYKLKGTKGEFIPEQRALGAKVILSMNNTVKEAGFYDLGLRTDSILKSYAFNYDRRESQLSYLSEEELAKLNSDQVEVLKAGVNPNFVERVGVRSRGIILWKWCIIAALLFLLLETLLIRLWRGR